ncbi:mediator of RNA polymerase II transcription subunit 15-like [Drosophila willistoni]|uniref:mediator of RNA polymerase II transcription subunit 15-like n=1 Tax=Drosophila willistoni TaxID=7260 RepID=UPI00017D7E20|nr:mediator of RNA polymerase II transcription subunit 15-like [Drosophila willistoni]
MPSPATNYSYRPRELIDIGRRVANTLNDPWGGFGMLSSRRELLERLQNAGIYRANWEPPLTNDVNRNSVAVIQNVINYNQEGQQEQQQQRQQQKQQQQVQPQYPEDVRDLEEMDYI